MATSNINNGERSVYRMSCHDKQAHCMSMEIEEAEKRQKQDLPSVIHPSKTFEDMKKERLLDEKLTHITLEGHRIMEKADVFPKEVDFFNRYVKDLTDKGAICEFYDQVKNDPNKRVPVFTAIFTVFLQSLPKDLQEGIKEKSQALCDAYMRSSPATREIYLFANQQELRNYFLN